MISSDLPVKDKEFQYLLMAIVVCTLVYFIYSFFTKSIPFNIILIALPMYLWFEGFKTSIIRNGVEYIDLIDKVAFSMLTICVVILIFREVRRIIKIVKIKKEEKSKVIVHGTGSDVSNIEIKQEDDEIIS